MQNHLESSSKKQLWNRYILRNTCFSKKRCSLTRIPLRYLRGFLYSYLKADTALCLLAFPHKFAHKSSHEKNCDYPKFPRKELRLSLNPRTSIPPQIAHKSSHEKNCDCPKTRRKELRLLWKTAPQGISFLFSSSFRCRKQKAYIRNQTVKS